MKRNIVLHLICCIEILFTNVFNTYFKRLENELKRLKCDLHSYNQIEKELKNQLNSALGDYSNISHDLTKLKQEHEDTKSK